MQEPLFSSNSEVSELPYYVNISDLFLKIHTVNTLKISCFKTFCSIHLCLLSIFLSKLYSFFQSSFLFILFLLASWSAAFLLSYLEKASFHYIWVLAIHLIDALLSSLPDSAAAVAFLHPHPHSYLPLLYLDFSPHILEKALPTDLPVLLLLCATSQPHLSKLTTDNWHTNHRGSS